MEDGSSSALVSILISWFPMLLLIGVWIFFMRKFVPTGSSSAQRWTREDSDEFLRLHRESVVLQRENNRLLTEFAAKLEK